MTRVRGYTSCPRADRAGIFCFLNAASANPDFWISGGDEKLSGVNAQRVEIQIRTLVDHLVLPTRPAFAKILKFFTPSGFSKRSA